jgi:hypothetical protein
MRNNLFFWQASSFGRLDKTHVLMRFIFRVAPVIACDDLVAAERSRDKFSASVR